jgi:phage gp36-like protein
MAYSDQTTIARFISYDELLRLTDREGAGQINPTVVDGAVQAADMEIDAYIGERHQLPLAIVPPVVAAISAKLAIYHLYLAAPGGPPAHWADAQRSQIRLLEQIAKGTISLGEGDPDAAGAGTPVDIESSDQLFSRDTLKGF